MIQRFIDYITIERHYSEKTCIAYEQDLQDLCAFLKVSPEELEPKRLETDDIRLWMVDMLEHGQSKRSVCRKLSSVRSFYKYLLKMGFVDVDITQKIIAPKLDKSLPIFFKPSEMAAEEMVEKCAETFEDFRDNLIIAMLYQTGMRRAELAALKRNDIDLRQGQIRVFGKRRKERVIPIGDNLIEKINEYYKIMQEENINAAEHFLIKINKDKEVSPLRVEDIYRVVRARMGDVSTLKKHSPHVLRHTFATAMLDNGADIRSIQHLLGHASLATTTIYTHTTFEQIKNQYNKAHPRAIKMKGERKNES